MQDSYATFSPSDKLEERLQFSLTKCSIYKLQNYQGPGNSCPQISDSVLEALLNLK
jgi:hypothetical protein